MSNLDRDKLIASALQRLGKIERSESFDPNVLGSKPTTAQQEILDDFGTIPTQWIVAANRSGKSQTCAKILEHVINDTHPTWRTPQQWLDEGLLILVAGRSGKIMEESLWPKIRSYLQPGTYKEVRTGNILQKVEIHGKHRIVFQSMENPSVARERIQSYDAHVAWVDEMVDSASVLNEIRLRVQTKHGLFLASFTPVDPSPEVERLVDGAALPHAKRYNLLTLDNPVFHSEEARSSLMSTFVGMSPEEIATRLTGKWATSDSKVYYFSWEKMVEMPVGYSPMWRHLEVVDPALSSALGLVILAENPETGMWYMTHSEYVRGISVPTELVAAVHERTKHLNIYKRISDPHEVWYMQTAASMGIHYVGVYKKNDRKPELIKGLQEKLGARIRIAPHNVDFIEEVQTCRYSDSGNGKIVNASRFHLLDAAMYGADQLPKLDRKIISNSWDQWLYKANEDRKVETEMAKKKIEKFGIRARTSYGQKSLPKNLGKFRWF